MLTLLFYMAIQNKIKPTDHARDKFSNVYVLCKDHLKWFYSTSKPLTFMQYFCSNLYKKTIHIKHKFRSCGHFQNQ